MADGTTRSFRGVLFKLLVTFAVLTIPVYLICLSVLNSAINTVKDQIAKSNMSELNRFLSGLETDLERVKKFQISLRNDENVQFLSTAQTMLTNYEKVALYKELLSKFDLIISNSSFINDLSIDFLDVNERLSYISGRSDIPDRDMGVYLNEDFSDGWLKTYYGKAALETQVGEVLTYALYMRSGGQGQEEIHYVLRMNIAIDKFRKMLQEFKIGQSGGAVIVDELHGVSIVPHRGSEWVPAVLKALESVRNNDESQQGELNVKIGRQDHIVMYKKSEALKWLVAVDVPEQEIMGEVQDKQRTLFLLIAVSAISVVGFAYVIYKQIHTPIRILYNAMRLVERDRYDTRIPDRRQDEFAYIYVRFNQMIQRIEHMIQKDYLQQIHIKQSELIQLQSQINPHFLYNCFYILYRMSKERDYEAIGQMTDYLGKYYQFITYKSSSEVVPLNEEVAHSVAYLNIQQIRFEDQLVHELRIDPNVADVPVPRLILQPLVENVIVHALEKYSRTVMVTIEAIRKDGDLELVVEDDGPGLSEEACVQLAMKLEQEHERPEASFALWNIHWRLRYRYGSNYGLTFRNRRTGGFHITIRLPGEDKG